MIVGYQKVILQLNSFIVI